jgi:carbonic anhydrase/acetyltransferase-like protein (isoleucine patch superfamily)
MAIYALGVLIPRIDPEAYVHPDAVIIGDVTVGPESSIWPGAVLRGDGGGHVVIGARTSIQDNTVVHCTRELPTIVGDECVICLVGSGAVILHEAIVRSGSVVAANAVVRNRMEVPSGALALGVPATVKLGAADAASIRHGVEIYVTKGREYRDGLRRVS